MSNKTVWLVVVILVLVGLYYWSMPAVNVEPAPLGAPVTDQTADVTAAVPATDVSTTEGAPVVPVAPVTESIVK